MDRNNKHKITRSNCPVIIFQEQIQLSQSYFYVLATDDIGTTDPIVGPASSPTTILEKFSAITYHKVIQM